MQSFGAFIELTKKMHLTQLSRRMPTDLWSLASHNRLLIEIQSEMAAL